MSETAVAQEFNDSTPTGAAKGGTGFPDVTTLDRCTSKAKAIKTAKQLQKAGFQVGIKSEPAEYKGDKDHFQVVYLS
jgi:hypothetical protein